MVYYSLSAAVALIAGLMLKKNGRIAPARIPVVIILIMLVTGFLSGSLTLWHGWVSTAPVEAMYYQRMLGQGMSPVMACYGAAMLIKVYDVLASAVLFAVVYIIMPRQLK